MALVIFLVLFLPINKYLYDLGKSKSEAEERSRSRSPYYRRSSPTPSSRQGSVSPPRGGRSPPQFMGGYPPLGPGGAANLQELMKPLSENASLPHFSHQVGFLKLGLSLEMPQISFSTPIKLRGYHTYVR